MSTSLPHWMILFGFLVLIHAGVREERLPSFAGGDGMIWGILGVALVAIGSSLSLAAYIAGHH